MSAVTIRLARRDELARILAIEASAARAFALHGQPLEVETSPPLPEHYAGPLAAGLLWVAEDEAGLVGFLAAEITGDALYVAEVDVALERQRQGVGRRLLRTAIDEAQARGLAAVTLETFRTIPWNGPFYASLGFRELAEAELSDHLKTAIALQVSQGFTDRCAMRLGL